MEEPNLLMRWTIYFFAGGSSAIWGAIVLAIVLTLSLRPRERRFVSPVIRLCLAVISIACIVCGSPPVPVWFQYLGSLWLVVALSSLSFHASNGPSTTAHRDFQNAFAVRLWRLSPAIWLSGFLLLELPWQPMPPVTPPVRQILVVGDSVTAGLNDHEVTWPRLLAQDAQVDVFDASQPGATLKSARMQNRLFLNRPGTLVLEIGGNDLLEGLPVAEFERHLSELLQEVVQPDRMVIMLELPLPPACARYGAAQRRQAQRYGAKLVPKRMFASVLTTKGSTVDGIHLSSAGQTLMKSRVESLLGSSLAAGSGNYYRLERGERAGILDTPPHY
ncbi:SGNH/GDSL hydrolase family protein [Schlesneria paludicola]|uniref:SGNH/GDSL hydrolase family protein n=1 Tax=Schlesneria paludicola TaxID=360056 RepID=UPI00029A889E|nr:GDSL-type esterase/lipase family protein [Schlesneria paludicola]